MKRTLLCLYSCFAFAACSEPTPISPCEELKIFVEKKIKDRGVVRFHVDIVKSDEDITGRVVGTCENGTKKLVYRRGNK